MKRLLFMLVTLVALVSCEKEKFKDDKWIIESPFGVTSVSGDGLPTRKIEKNKSLKLYKISYDYIDVSCNNCAYRVNGKQYSISTRFFSDGTEKPF